MPHPAHKGKNIHTRTTSRDLFLHLFSLVALITTISSFLGVVFQVLNIQFPIDELYETYGRQGAISGLRVSLSTLIIFFPAYMWSVWYIEKMFKTDPTRAMVGIRKWLVYFILFAASMTILINLVVTVNVLLNGETTLRFALKALAVLVVAGGIMGYYVSTLRRYATH